MTVILVNKSVIDGTDNTQTVLTYTVSPEKVCHHGDESFCVTSLTPLPCPDVLSERVPAVSFSRTGNQISLVRVRADFLSDARSFRCLELLLDNADL